jgi:hypothetical protein
LADDRRGCFQGYFRRDCVKAARQKMTDTVEKGLVIFGEQ